MFNFLYLAIFFASEEVLWQFGTFAQVSFTFLHFFVIWELRVYHNLTKSLLLTFLFFLHSLIIIKIRAFLIYPGIGINCTLQPCLGGYPLRIKLTHGHLHGCVHAPMFLLDGANCTASLQHLHVVLGCASLSHILSQFLITMQSYNDFASNLD